MKLLSAFRGAFAAACVAIAIASPSADAVEPLSGAVKISAGEAHTCVLMQAGTVQCWGAIQYQQLGSTPEGSGPDGFPTAITVNYVAQAVAISAGRWHTCAALANGTVLCWGSNFNGESGYPAGSPVSYPQTVIGIDNAVEVASGDSHSCALTQAGGAKCWGNNGGGNLGDGTRTSRHQAAHVSGLASGVKAVASASSASCALMTTGIVKCWGNNASGQLGHANFGPSGINESLTPIDVPGLSNVAILAAGYTHFCAVTVGGAAKCWGNNYDAQLGEGSTSPRVGPVDVTGLSSGVAAIYPGYAHTCALLISGSLKCWGNNAWGQLGDGTLTSRLTPVDATAAGSSVTAAAVGLAHTCVLKNGSAYCWGADGAEQAGGGSGKYRNAMTVTGLSAGVAQIDVGIRFSCARTTAGGVKCWGNNDLGQIGDGTQLRRDAPVDVSGLTSGVASIATGWHHACALTTAGGVKCWGNNSYFQLGDGTYEPRLTPVDVSELVSGVAMITAGVFHSCALTTAGGVKCWGSNAFGQLGDDTITDRSAPVNVVGLSSGVISISAGSVSTCAVLAGGAVKCWGGNQNGQLGDGTYLRKQTPTQVSGLTSGYAQVSVGSGHACARSTSGGLVCWGFGAFGQLGNNSTGTAGSNVPVAVSSLASGATALNLGANHSCAIAAGGVGKCWGWSTYMQTGSAFADLGVPTDVQGLPAVTGIAAALKHSCAVTGAGAAMCWGSNADSALGTGGYGGTTVAGQVRMADLTPDAFSFTPQTGVTVSTMRVSNPVTITGMDTNRDAALWIVNGEYSYGCNGVFQSWPVMVRNGQVICVRHLSSAQPGTTTITTLHVGSASAAFSSTTAFATPRRADMNGDGRSDLIWYHAGTFSLVGISANGLSLGSAYAIDVQTDANWKVAGLADLNGDGRADVVWRNDATGEVYGLLMNGSTILSEGLIYAEPNLDWKIEQVADLDGDGRADLVWKNQSTGEVYVMRMNGLAIASGQVVYIEPNLSWKIVASGDMNGDGRADLLWRNVATGDVFAMLMNGFTVLSGGVIYTEPNLAWKIVGLADFNNDGRADVLWQSTATGDVFEMQMNGTVVSAGQVVYNEPNTQWKIVALGDYNGDGRADILWRNAATGHVYMMLMNGFAIAGADFVYTEPDAQWQIVGP